jgi:hypothetical protein
MTGRERVPDNGWELLIAALVAEISPDLVTTEVDTEERPLVRQDCTDKDGVTTTSWVQLSEEDWAEIAEGIDSSLIDAGVTPFPRPATVYLTLPPGVADLDELSDRLTPAQYEGDLPSQQVGMMRRIIRRLYG